jgi:hypothetical protein
VSDDDDWLEPWCAQVRMLLAEAGYPDAHVYPEATGIFVEGAPDAAVAKAFAVIDGREGT